MRVLIWTFKLKPYTEKSPGNLEPGMMHKFQTADTYSFSLLVPALAPCAEHKGSSPVVASPGSRGVSFCVDVCVVSVRVRACVCVCPPALAYLSAYQVSPLLNLVQWDIQCEPQGSNA